MSTPISDSYETGPFETFLARWSDEVNGLTQDVQTWAGNMLNENINYNFATAQAQLTAALKTFMSSIQTVVG